MTIEDDSNAEWTNMENNLIHKFTAQEINKYKITNDIEATILRNRLSITVEKIIKDLISIEKRQTPSPENDFQLIQNMTKAEENIIDKANLRLEHEESFCIIYHSIRDKIEETNKDGSGLILFVGAGVSKAIKNIHRIVSCLLDEKGIPYSIPWKDDNWELIEPYRSEIDNIFSEQAVFVGMETTKAQEIIAELYHNNKFLIRQLVVFNWDNVIETASYRIDKKRLEVGTDIIVCDDVPHNFNLSKIYIWHPHGYVGNKNRFVLPYENGFLPKKFKDICGRFPGIFLIVGHREEKNNSLTSTLGKRGRDVIRIRTDFTQSKELSLNLECDDFFTLLQSWINN